MAISSENLFYMISLFSLLILSLVHPIAANPAAKSYIVYMGRSTKEQGDIEDAKLSHLTLLSSVIPSEESERLFLKHIYHHSFKGFSAMLTDEEASLLSESDEVVSIFPDTKLQLHTTRSWDFLESTSGGMGRIQRLYPNGSNDVIVGVIDTGIWPESPSFSDDGFSEIPSRWKGTCMEGNDFNKSHYNRKLIGARYYDLSGNATSKSKPIGSPRDDVGHGTHVASIAVGNLVPNASDRGLARGLAKGGFPSSRFASYKACNQLGCFSSAILKAIDDAIEDGVDILSLSIGRLLINTTFSHDPVALGSLHAVQAGIMVVAGAGNDGPNPSTVVNTAPWIMTIAASTTDRTFGSNIILGNKKVIQGFGIVYSNSKASPLVFGGDAAVNSSSFKAASNCAPESLDRKKVEGKIVLCIDDQEFRNLTREKKEKAAWNVFAEGLILVDQATERSYPLSANSDYYSQVDSSGAAQILEYIKSNKNPTATILRSVDIPKFKPAPVIWDRSSRGPGKLTEGILKPDLAAPGVGILASWPQDDDITNGFAMGKPTIFAFESGTSMACPHVSGAAAYVKSVRPKWTPSMLRSALMTTATITNNAGNPIMNDKIKASASPHDMGAGELSPSRALHPGLVYETSTTDYLNFLCYFGYNTTTVRSMLDRKFTCPTNSSEDLISDINYPSISIAKLQGARTITRTVTNVGNRNSTYNVKIDSPDDLVVRVSPEALVFSPEYRKASFEVSFVRKGATTKGYKFGSVTWSDGRHLVRSVFAVNVI